MGEHEDKCSPRADSSITFKLAATQLRHAARLQWRETKLNISGALSVARHSGKLNNRVANLSSSRDAFYRVCKGALFGYARFAWFCLAAAHKEFSEDP
jgi:hypothetical protein